MASPINSEAIEAALAKPDYIPPGVTAEFLEQSRDGPVVTGILFIGALVTVVMALRCFARVWIVKKFGLDDWLALITMVRRDERGRLISEVDSSSSCHTGPSLLYA
jgi:hypothetical protein